MIYIERTIIINNNEATIEQPIVLYKGDRNIELQFAIENNPFKYKAGTAVTYGQLVIKRPNTAPIFSEPAKLSNNKVLFIVTGDMIDELIEIGDYNFQIRMINSDQSSRGTLPPVSAGITIKEPICEEATASATYVNSRRAVVPASNSTEDTFDEDGNYNMTTWSNGDIITDTKLNKVESAIYTINNNVTTDYSTTRYVDTSIADLEHQVELTMEVESAQIKEYVSENYSTKDYVNNVISNSNMMNRDYVDSVINNIEIPEVDLTGYASERYVDAAIANVELMPGPQGEPGPQGPQGPAGKDADPADLTGYATEEYVNNLIGDIEIPEGGNNLPIRVIGSDNPDEPYIFTGDEFTYEDYENGICLPVLLDNVDIAGTIFINELGHSWLWTDGDNKVISYDSQGFYYEFVIAPDGTITEQNTDSRAWASDLDNYATKEELQEALGDINAILDAINGEEV